MRLLGTLFVIFGVVLLIYGGVTLFIPSDTHDMGPLSITVHENLVIPLPPILGLLCLIVGAVVIASAPVYIAPPPPGA